VVWTGGIYGEVYAAPATLLADPAEFAKAAAKGIKEEAEAAGLHDAKILLEFGDAADHISRAAETHDVDVVVVGAHTKKFLRRLIDPSVTDRVVHSAHRPVLVVGTTD
jgi:nucleotide-binding universal stress UspA family protein